MGEADVQKALERLASTLEAKSIPYAIIGALALNEWGYRRVTVDVEVLLAALLPLDKLIELKLASAISAPHRLKDLADVLELIRVLSLPREKGLSLDASVRAKYEELWQAAQTADRE